MRRLIVNADDFGRSPSINQAVIEGSRLGVVTSASIMVDAPAFQEAVVLAKENPALGVGLHLDLDRCFVVHHGAGTLLRYNAADWTHDRAAGEIARQIEALLKAGITPDHLDGHHHCHLRPEIFPLAAAQCRRFNIPAIRFASDLARAAGSALPDEMEALLSRLGIRHPAGFFDGIDASLAAPWEGVSECMAHPGKEAWRAAESEALRRAAARWPSAIQRIRFSDLGTT